MDDARYRVFISHASDDLAVARLLSGYVEAVSAEYVLDAHHLDGGADFYDWMCRNIQTCQELLILLSPAALVSDWVSFEIGLAEAKGLWIAPILYQLDVAGLRKTRIGQSLLARKAVLNLEQFATYQTQLASRVATYDVGRAEGFEYPNSRSFGTIWDGETS